MATTGGDARTKRAEARNERRARSATKSKDTSEPRGDEAQASESSNGETENGGGGLSTPKLMAAGAAAGALLGTAKAVRDRRHAHDGEEDDHEEHEEGEQRGTRGREGGEQESGQQAAGLRGLVVSVLEAALDALHEPGEQARHETEHPGEERDREEEDDDDEAEREPRDEQSDDGRPTARGESGEAGEPGDDDEEESGPRAGADEGAAGSAEAEAQQSPDAVSDQADEEDAEDEAEEDDDDERERHQQHRNGSGDAAKIVARAREQLAAFVGKQPESTSRVEQVDDGWQLAFEVVELPRVPSSTDVMASYAVTVDGSGSVIDYERTSRYYRNRAEGSA
jgi:hypothetical protein